MKSAKRKTIMIDGVRYYAERPHDCRKCFFWKNRKVGCIIYTIVQQMWPSAFILIAMEACIIIITFGAGILEGLLQMAGECCKEFLRK